MASKKIKEAIELLENEGYEVKKPEKVSTHGDPSVEFN